ncbi:MAG: arginine deiminase family protein [Mycoplasmoidaceae bacterium]
MINVYSEIGKLRKILVHTPMDEIKNISPKRLDELLFSALLEYDSAIKGHQAFISILEENGVEVVQLVDLLVETYQNATNGEREAFINQWLDEVHPKIMHQDLRRKLYLYLKSIKEPKALFLKMMGGIFASEIKYKSKHELIADPMPNLYFTRDPFSTIGNGVSIHKMKYETRRRETLFSQFIFDVHPEYQTVPKYYDRHAPFTIEGGDIFIYNSDNLVIGLSERTEKKAILRIAKNINKNHDCKFKKIYVVNIPKAKNLMHLDTWLTMVDHNKFIYSKNMVEEMRFFVIDLKKPHKMTELKITLKAFLKKVIKQTPILIPVAGEKARQIDVDIETHFDATNYLVIEPGVVVGYHRNKKTEAALEKVGVKVLSFNGNQLSLGMGSSRCMSMPLIRDDLK